MAFILKPNLVKILRQSIRTSLSQSQLTLVSGNDLTTYGKEFFNQTTVKSVQTTTSIRQPVLSLPKQIPIQPLLYKTTTCLTRPATPFFVSQMKKNLSKTTTTKLYPAKKWETNIRQECIKTNNSLIIFTLVLLSNAKFV